MNKITQDILNNLNLKLFEAERDLHNEEDFTEEEIPSAINGIKWFVQEWLPKHVE